MDTTHTTRLLPNVPRLFRAHISMYPQHLSHPFSYAENSLTQKSHRNTQHSQTAKPTPPQLVLKATHCQQYVLSLTIFNLDQQCAFYYYCSLIIYAFFSAIVVTSATFISHHHVAFGSLICCRDARRDSYVRS